LIRASSCSIIELAERGIAPRGNGHGIPPIGALAGRKKASSMRRAHLYGAVLIAFCLVLPQAARAFGINDVCKMSKDGVSDSLIIRKIELSHKKFRLDSQDFHKLQKAGVSDKVISAMLETEASSKDKKKAEKEQLAYEKEQAKEQGNGVPQYAGPYAGPYYAYPYYVPYYVPYSSPFTFSVGFGYSYYAPHYGYYRPYYPYYGHSYGGYHPYGGYGYRPYAGPAPIRVGYSRH
jgi:hypothetical protein